MRNRARLDVGSGVNQNRSHAAAAASRQPERVVVLRFERRAVQHAAVRREDVRAALHERDARRRYTVVRLLRGNVTSERLPELRPFVRVSGSQECMLDVLAPVRVAVGADQPVRRRAGATR